MRRKALWRLVAAMVGAVLLVPGAVQPARADDANWDSYVDLGIDVLTSFLQKSEDGLDAFELLELTRQLKDALLGVKSDLFSHVDQLAVADIRADARFTVDNVRMLDLPATRGAYVIRVAGAAANAREKLTVFSSDAHRDTVGRAIIAEYQALLVGQGRLGMAPAYDQYEEALRHVIDNVTPTCTEFYDPKLGSYTHSCNFNGKNVTGKQRISSSTGLWEHSYDGVNWHPGEMSRAVVVSKVMEQTVQDLAKQALAQLMLHDH